MMHVKFVKNVEKINNIKTQFEEISDHKFASNISNDVPLETKHALDPLATVEKLQKELL